MDLEADASRLHHDEILASGRDYSLKSTYHASSDLKVILMLDRLKGVLAQLRSLAAWMPPKAAGATYYIGLPSAGTRDSCLFLALAQYGDRESSQSDPEE